MKIKCTIVILSVLWWAPLAAHNVGTFGRVWPIVEVNAKQEIANELSHVDTHTPQIRLRAALAHMGQHLPPAQLPLAIRQATTYYDPSIALHKDIWVRGRLLYKKGTWVNPLSIVRPVQNMLYFNGKDPKQLRFALAALTAMPTRLMLVMTQGDPIALSAKLHRPIYYARPTLITRFHISAVPSLLGVGKNATYHQLAVTTFTPPYTVAHIKQCWHGCRMRTIP